MGSVFLVLQLLALVIATRVFVFNRKPVVAAGVYVVLRVGLLFFATGFSADVLGFAAAYAGFLGLFWSAAFYLLISLVGSRFRLYLSVLLFELLSQFAWHFIASSIF